MRGFQTDSVTEFIDCFHMSLLPIEWIHNELTRFMIGRVKCEHIAIHISYNRMRSLSFQYGWFVLSKSTVSSIDNFTTEYNEEFRDGCEIEM